MISVNKVIVLPRAPFKVSVDMQILRFLEKTLRVKLSHFHKILLSPDKNGNARYRITKAFVVPYIIANTTILINAHDRTYTDEPKPKQKRALISTPDWRTRPNSNPIRS